MSTERQVALQAIKKLSNEIEALSNGSSLATLEHKLKLRQQAIEQFFMAYQPLENPQETDFFQNILQHAKNLTVAMEQTKQEKSTQLIQSKKSGKRIRLYTSIAQQK